MPDPRRLDAIGAIEPTTERVALRAAARIPGGGRRVAVQVSVVLDIVALLESDDDPVAHERAQPAVVRVVRRADKRERGVVAVLVPVDLLPVARGVVLQRVRDVREGAEEVQYERATEARRGHRAHADHTALDDLATSKTLVH